MLSTLTATVLTTLAVGLNTPTASSAQLAPIQAERTVAEHQFSLEDRYPVAWVNEAFKKNILLNMAYLEGEVSKKEDIAWDRVEHPFQYQFTLKPGEIFAFHDNVLPEYKGKVSKTTHAFFNSQQGFVSDGYLVGDGVCHLASLINWVAQDAHLSVLVTKNHDFAKIAEVPKEYGVSIFATVDGEGAHNNLYITNTKDHEVTFHFVYQDNNLHVFITEPMLQS